MWPCLCNGCMVWELCYGGMTEKRLLQGLSCIESSIRLDDILMHSQATWSEIDNTEMALNIMLISVLDRIFVYIIKMFPVGKFSRSD